MEKNRMVKSLLGMLVSLPEISVAPSRNRVAEVMTGKFCRRLAPVSESGSGRGVAGLSPSLGVTPPFKVSAPSRIPSSALSWMELARMALPVPELGSDNPCKPTHKPCDAWLSQAWRDLDGRGKRVRGDPQGGLALAGVACFVPYVERRRPATGAGTNRGPEG